MNARAIVASAAAAAALGAAAAPAAAVTGFDGSCAVRGHATFEPPGGFLPAVTDDVYVFRSEAPSTCAGRVTFDGRPVGGTRTWDVEVWATNTGKLSCAATALPGGTGHLRFLEADGDPARAGRSARSPELIVRFGIDVASAGNQVTVRIAGGSDAAHPLGTQALGRAEFPADEPTLRGCAEATVGTLPFTATITTGPSVRDAGAPDALLLDRGPAPAA